jgi:hypothetical protein
MSRSINLPLHLFLTCAMAHVAWLAPTLAWAGQRGPTSPAPSGMPMARTAPAAPPRDDRFTRFDLAGVYPGLSPAATASFFSKSMPGWGLAAPDDRSFTDALANDCPLAAPGLWTCEAALAGADRLDPNLIEIQTRYRSSLGDARSKTLSRLRLRMGWISARARGWDIFLQERSAPDRSSALARSKALKAFSNSEAIAPLASAAKNYRAALWRLRSPDGAPFELAVVAALDAKGSLVAMACEISAPEAPEPPSKALLP